MPTEEFTISYNGEAVRNGQMDVRELAPALLAAGTLLQKANALLNGDRARVSVKVRSEFKHASFHVACVVTQDLIDQAKTFLLRHPDIKDAKDILEIIFFYAGGGVGLFRLIKWLKKRQPTEGGITFKDNGIVEITVEGSSVQTTNNVYNLYLDSEVRQAAERIVAPLKHEGMESLEVRAGDNEERVTTEEAESFEVEPEGDLSLDNTSDVLLEIVRLSYKPEHKWGFSDGDRNFNAAMEDQEFWDQIISGMVRFTKGDQIRARLRTRTFSGVKSQSSCKREKRWASSPLVHATASSAPAELVARSA
jgi:hypothetical protein